MPRNGLRTQIRADPALFRAADVPRDRPRRDLGLERPDRDHGGVASGRWSLAQRSLGARIAADVAVRSVSLRPGTSILRRALPARLVRRARRSGRLGRVPPGIDGLAAAPAASRAFDAEQAGRGVVHGISAEHQYRRGARVRPPPSQPAVDDHWTLVARDGGRRPVLDFACPSPPPVGRHAAGFGDGAPRRSPVLLRHSLGAWAVAQLLRDRGEPPETGGAGILVGR